MRFGYIRVSCADKQEFFRQEFALQDHKIDKLYEEKISGTKKASTRPEFEKMVAELSAGDEVYFESMSRMARSMQDLIDTTNMLVKKKKVKVVFLKENLTIGGDNNNDAMATLIFNIMGSFAQFERDLIAERTRQGLKARRELLGNAFKIGREKLDIPADKIEQIRQLYGTCSVAEIQRRVGLGRRIVDRVIREECRNEE